MLEHLIVRWGTLAVLLGAAVEGDVTMILAGVMAHLGLLAFPTAVGAGALGGFIGDLGWFGLGRTHAVAIRDSRLYARSRPAIERLTRLAGAWQVVIARFVYGTRIASMLFWGVQGLSPWRFAAIDALGCILWAAVFGGLGFIASDSAQALIGRVRRLEIWLLVALVVSAVVLVGIRILLRFTRRAALKGGGRKTTDNGGDEDP